MSTIGVLALQGDFEKHAQAINKLGHSSVLVKDSASLVKSDRLIIPGGESTTMIKLIDRLDLREDLVKYGKSRPVFGTCAGLIIVASHVENSGFTPLSLIDLNVRRNAYGRQINSFIDDITLTTNGIETLYEAIFIRAPKITGCGNSTKPLAYHKNDIVMAGNENILVATFHPELTDDLRIHDFFLNHFG
ncbi:MAG: pyridoxal 5'-phosphate synthase glutaminase subunit PdxT [Calditrichaeota bacterium]|nr:pyridoxal 5'-phosphate synthase glutaminase subunit PdxT [Calditrichota bacterium]